MNPALFLLFIAWAPGAEARETDVPPVENYEMGIAVGRVWEGDPGGGRDLDGYRIGLVSFSEGAGAPYGNAGSWYVEWKESRQQEILEGGLAVSYPYFRFSRFGFGPRYKLAIQKRAEPPDRGIDGVLGVGFELGAWLSERVHVAALAHRSVGFEAGARTSYSVDLRMMLWDNRGR